MPDTERPVEVETVYPDGTKEKLKGPFVVYIDPKRGKIGVRGADGYSTEVPVVDVWELIKDKMR